MTAFKLQNFGQYASSNHITVFEVTRVCQKPLQRKIDSMSATHLPACLVPFCPVSDNRDLTHIPQSFRAISKQAKAVFWERFWLSFLTLLEDYNIIVMIVITAHAIDRFSLGFRIIGNIQYTVLT